MELAIQIFIVIGFVFLMLSQAFRFIDEYRMGKWVKINQEARTIIIYYLDITGMAKALDLCKQIQYFAKFYSCGYKKIENKIIFDDDSSIELRPYGCVESPIAADVYYFPKSIGKRIAPNDKDNKVNYFY